MHKPCLLTLMLITQLTFISPSKAEDPLKSVINAYTAKDYRKTIQLGESLVQKQPSNAQARYYMGNAYVQLHQMDQAEAQYRRCIDLNPNSDLAQNANSALNSISRYLSPSKSIEGKHGKKHGGKNKNKNNNNSSPEAQQIRNEAQQRIQMKTEDANRQIEKIRSQSKQDIASIPTRAYRMTGGNRGKHHHGGRMRGRKNPDYTANKAEISNDAEARIHKIQDALARDKRAIQEDADRRIDALRH